MRDVAHGPAHGSIIGPATRLACIGCYDRALATRQGFALAAVAALIAWPLAWRLAPEAAAGRFARDVRMLKDNVLPRVATVRDALGARYAAGAAGLAEVLPVRRESSAAQLDYLEALREVMLAWGELQAFR
jgi:hypothetical protein